MQQSRSPARGSRYEEALAIFAFRLDEVTKVVSGWAGEEKAPGVSPHVLWRNDVALTS